MSTIPASGIVNVVPSVLAAGGIGLTGIGLILSHNARLPVGAVESFSGEQAVSSFFGASDALVAEAGIYFDGFEGASIQPSTLLMAQFNQAEVAAWLRGGNISGLTLSQLQAINGSLDILIDGVAHNASALNLSAATSPSNAASIIQTAINGSLATLASATGVVAAESASITASIAGYVMTVTAVGSGTLIPGSALSGTGVTANTVLGNQLSGTPGGIGTYAVSISQVVASTTITAAYGQLTISGGVTGAFAVGQTISGAGVVAGTQIVALGTGTGGDGTYFVNNNTAVSSTTISAEGTNAVVTYDSVSGGFVVTSGVVGTASTIAFATGTTAAALLLTSATGATLSQGANALTPSAFMTALAITNNSWVNFMTHFDPDGGSGNAVKQQFAAWNTVQNSRYGYFCWDPDASPAASNPAASSLGQILKANGNGGTLLIWEGVSPAPTSDTGLCAFALGLAASINYQQTNGRTDFAFRQGSGEIANVTDPTTAANLTANGYCFYGAYGSAAAPDIWFQNGQITGPFAWADSYETQIWLNSLFQSVLLTLFANSLSVPFTTAGIALIEETLGSVIQQGLAFGAFAPNTLNSAQIAQVNAAAGANIASALQSQGYYLQVLLPNQTVQAARGPWPMVFWYIDRNSVQSITLSSVLVQ
jgi:uncharacterized protein DUF3383